MLFPKLHLHPLAIDSTNTGHMCDFCKVKIKTSVALRCQTCDVDMCLTCFRKKDSSHAEGIVRTDKGASGSFAPSASASASAASASGNTLAEQDEKNRFSTCGYVARALTLVRPYTCWILISVVSLLISSAASLFTPNFQANIIDSLGGGLHFNRDDFTYYVKLYLIVSLGNGVLGAFKSAAFSVVGARMSIDNRNMLFRSILHQDIAFFDGTVQCGAVRCRTPRQQKKTTNTQTNK